MATGRDPKDAFAEIYDQTGRDDLLRAGKTHLDGNLRLAARRHTRWFHLTLLALAAAAVITTILGAIYVLNLSMDSARKIEQRQERKISDAAKEVTD